MERPLNFAMWIATCLLVIATLAATGYAYVWVKQTSDRMHQIAQKQKAEQDKIWSM